MKSKENARRLVSITVRLAEMEGFEPPRWFPNLPVFKTGPFNPLGTSPCCSIVLDFLLDTDGNRNRRTAKSAVFLRLCGIGRSVSPHGFQDRPVVTASVTLRKQRDYNRFCPTVQVSSCYNPLFLISEAAFWHCCRSGYRSSGRTFSPRRGRPAACCSCRNDTSLPEPG